VEVAWKAHICRNRCPVPPIAGYSIQSIKTNGMSISVETGNRRCRRPSIPPRRGIPGHGYFSELISLEYFRERNVSHLLASSEDQTARERSVHLTGRLLQFYRPRKVNIVFKMDVLMQVLLELPQAVVERVKGRTRILWSREIST
jgi:hypothetical protein